MKTLVWWILVLQLVALIAVSVVAIDAQRTERDLAQKLLEAQVSRVVIQLRGELAFEIAATLPEDAETKAQAVLKSISPDLSLTILTPSGVGWISAGTSIGLNAQKDQLRRCTSEFLIDKDRIGTVSSTKGTTLEVLGCGQFNAADDEEEPAKWYTFVVLASRRVPATSTLEAGIGVAVLALGLSLLLSLALGISRQPSPLAQPIAPAAPRAKAFPNGEIASTDFEVVVVPMALSNSDTTPNELLSIATIAVRKRQPFSPT